MGMDTTPTPHFHTRIVFDGTAYIDTNILMPENGSIRFTTGWETTKGPQAIFNFGSRVYAILNSSTDENIRGMSFGYDAASAQVYGTTISVNWSYDSYGLFLTPKRCGVGSNTTTFTKGSSRPVTGLVIGQNATHTNTPFTGKISGWIRIYDSNAQNATSYSDLNNYTPVATLRPCTYMGEAGFWHVEEGVFYGNTAGAGQLICED